MALPGQSHHPAQAYAASTAAFISAACHLAAGVIFVCVRLGVVHSSFEADEAKLKALDPEYIKDFFHYEADVRGWLVAGQVVLAMGWASMLPVLNTMAGALARDSPSLAGAGSTWFALGVVIVLMDFMLAAGTTDMVGWIRSDFTLSDQDYKALMLSYLLQESRNVWILAADWAFMAGGFLCVGLAAQYSVHGQGRGWGKVAIACTGLSFVVFALDVAREADRGDWEKISKAQGVMQLFLNCIVLPVLLIWLGSIVESVQQAAISSAFYQSYAPQKGGSDDPNLEAEQGRGPPVIELANRDQA